MSNDEQERRFKGLERWSKRVSIGQAITVASVLFAVFTWYNSRAEKRISDADILLGKFDHLEVSMAATRKTDSFIYLRRKTSDSIVLAIKFEDLKKGIGKDIDQKLITTSRRLDELEKRIKISFVGEVKKNGPYSLPTLTPVKN